MMSLVSIVAPFRFFSCKPKYRANALYHLNCLLAVRFILLFFYLVLGDNLYLASILATPFISEMSRYRSANGKTGKSSAESSTLDSR